MVICRISREIQRFRRFPDVGFPSDDEGGNRWGGSQDARVAKSIFWGEYLNKNRADRSTIDVPEALLDLFGERIET